MILLRLPLDGATKPYLGHHKIGKPAVTLAGELHQQVQSCVESHGPPLALPGGASHSPANVTKIAVQRLGSR